MCQFTRIPVTRLILSSFHHKNFVKCIAIYIYIYTYIISALRAQEAMANSLAPFSAKMLPLDPVSCKDVQTPPPSPPLRNAQIFMKDECVDANVKSIY